jgi:hypothetical protein
MRRNASAADAADFEAGSSPSDGGAATRGLRPHVVWDALGLSLVGALATWTFLAAAISGGRPLPTVALLLASTGVFVVARIVGSFARWAVPLSIVVAAAVVAGFGSYSIVGGGPLGGPFGYRNATGAFFVQAAIAALMVALVVQYRPLRVIAVAVMVPLAVIVAKDSRGAAAGLVVVAVVVLTIGGIGSVRAAIVVAAVLFASVFAGTVVLAAGYQHRGDGVLVRALTERRLVLWHESLTIMTADPGGVGPGRFMYVSPTAIRDADAHWAHEEFLQLGVELGWAGLALVLLLFAWGFSRLWVHPAPDGVVALGAASLAALGIHACVDYILHFPAIPLTAMALLGTAISSTRTEHAADDADDHRT